MAWEQLLPDSARLLPHELENWDYQSTITLARTLSVDPERVLAGCDLARESDLAILVTGHSRKTSVNLTLAVQELHEGTYDYHLQVDVPGESMGGLLEITTLLVVVHAVPQSSLAPTRPGSIIWSDVQSCRLEGVGTQFPSEAFDFALSRRMDPKAGWRLDIDVADPEAEFLGVARLFLNSGIPAIAAMLSGSKDAKSEELARIITWDVTRQLVLIALRWDDVIGSDPDSESTAVAGVLRNVLQQVWPHESPKTLRRWLEDDAGRLEMRLQERCDLLGMLG
jgi:hypothetical protein